MIIYSSSKEREREKIALICFSFSVFVFLFIFLFSICFCIENHEFESKSVEAMSKQMEIVDAGRMVADEKEMIENALSNVMNPLKAAKLALIDIDKSKIIEIMETETPPTESIEIVCECFVIIKGIRDITWRTVRSLMSEEGFFKSLMEMNCDLITSKQLLHCKNHLKVSERIKI